MPVLFVDYDQGAGGEYFCQVVSQAPECVTLSAKKFESGRTKINDRFGQEFFKPRPSIDINLVLSESLYELIPAHRTTTIARQLLGNIFSIRIAWPIEPLAYQFLQYQKIHKVLLVSEPSDQYFIGYLKFLKEVHNNTEFLKRVDRSMDNLSLNLLAINQEPTLENRQQYLDNLYIYYARPEPDYKYDLVIPYETLISDPDLVASQLTEKFGITIDAAPFKKYRDEYQQFQTSTY